MSYFTSFEISWPTAGELFDPAPAGLTSNPTLKVLLRRDRCTFLCSPLMDPQTHSPDNWWNSQHLKVGHAGLFVQPSQPFLTSCYTSRYKHDSICIGRDMPPRMPRLQRERVLLLIWQDGRSSRHLLAAHECRHPSAKWVKSSFGSGSVFYIGWHCYPGTPVTNRSARINGIRSHVPYGLCAPLPLMMSHANGNSVAQACTEFLGRPQQARCAETASGTMFVHGHCSTGGCKVHVKDVCHWHDISVAFFKCNIIYATPIKGSSGVWLFKTAFLMQLRFNFLWISCLNKQWNANICGQMFVFWTERLHLMSVVCSRTLWVLLMGIHWVRTGLSVMSALSSLLRLCLFTSTLGLNWLRGLCCVMKCSFFWGGTLVKWGTAQVSSPQLLSWQQYQTKPNLAVWTLTTAKTPEESKW